ncbi:MAG TPA: penicillin acylase family protein [Candidatus Limnocylindrales bacterium]|nr:penicillin acylase family protein [Candidatus Limnocylindrales bacterium]
MLRVGRRAGSLLGSLIRLVAVLVSLLIVAIAVVGAITTQRGWPQTTGTLVVKGLNASATVIRDSAGIIQISADSPHDLFLAQGYVHAQERMWQMELSRRIGAGRLSELFGKSEVDTDRYVRTLGFRIAAQRDLDAMSAQSKAILEAYADGVNAWIDEHNGRLSTPFVVAGALAGTYDIGGYRLEPWTPLDTATWQKVQAWALGGNVDSEIFRMLADARLADPRKTDELFPAYAAEAPIITPSGSLGDGGAGPGTASGAAPPASAATVPPPAAATSRYAEALASLGSGLDRISAIAGIDSGGALVGDHGVGSNDWVIAGSRTASGKPILANDPHLGFAMPAIWIMNGLHCRTLSDACPWNVVGVTFPGAPAVVLGHNARIAWGATNVNPDTQDLFLEKVDPANAANYLFRGASIPFTIRHETIKVAGGADVGLDVRSTGHGVVLSDVDDRLKDGPVLAMRWTTTAEVDLALESFFKIDLATSFDEFRAAFDDYGSPSQNFVYADVDGNIGYVLPGLIPERAGPLGDRVRDGSSGDAEWTGYVPRDKLPWQRNPKAGQIVSANNAPVDAKYPFWIGNEFDPGYRAAQIAARLGQLKDGAATTSDMGEIEMDTHVGRADKLIPLLVGFIPTPSTEDGRALWTSLTRWDRQCTVDSTGCTAFATLELGLMRAIFDDELGPIAREYVGSTMSWEALLAVLGDRASSWWLTSGATSGSGPAPAAIISSVVDQTAAQLRQRYGDPSRWTWGTVHQVQFRESTLGSSGILPLEWYFDSPSRPVAGADGAIDNNYYRVQRAYADPGDATYKPLGNVEVFGVTNGPSYRFTIDMGDIEGARIIITTGQSGNPGDPHYGDLIPLWADGQTVPLPFSVGSVQASATQTLTLTPP